MRSARKNTRYVSLSQCSIETCFSPLVPFAGLAVLVLASDFWLQRQLAIFESGRYIYEIEECTFDMAEHNALLDATREEVKAMKARQAKAQAEMDKVEAELMAKWMEEKAAGKIPMDKVEALLNGMSQISIAIMGH